VPAVFRLFDFLSHIGIACDPDSRSYGPQVYRPPDPVSASTAYAVAASLMKSPVGEDTSRRWCKE
jgi:hypothetical protein